MLNTYFFFVSFITCTKNTYFIHFLDVDDKNRINSTKSV